MLTVVLDTISAFFSSPFSENSTSLQVGACCGPLRGGESQSVHIHVSLPCISCQCCVTNCPQSTNMHYLTVSVGRELQWELPQIRNS